MKNQTRINEIEALQNQLLEDQNNSIFLQNTLNSIQNGICIIDKDFKIIKANNWTNNYYKNKNTLVGQYCFQVFCNRKSVCKECPSKYALKTGEPNVQVIPFSLEENKKRWMEVIAFPVKNNKKVVDQTFVIFRDVSEQKSLELKLKEKAQEYEEITRKLEERNIELKATEKALRTNLEKLQDANLQVIESKQKYEGLYNYTPLAYHSLDIDGNIIDVNPAWLKILGYTKDEVVGKWFGSFLHPDFVSKFRKNFPFFKEQGYINDELYKMVRKDGGIKYISLEGRVGYTPDGDFEKTFCTLKDITREKLFESSLKASEDRFRTLLNTVPFGIQFTNKEGKILFCNHATQQSIGRQKNEIEGVYIWDFFTDEQKKTKIKKDYLKTINKQPIPKDYFNKQFSKEGVEIDLQTTWDYVRNESGEVEGIISVTKDITESIKQQKNLESALENAHIRQNEITALLEASKFIPSAKTFNSAAQEIFNIFKKLIGAKSGYVALLSKDGNENEVIFLDSESLPSEIARNLPTLISSLKKITHEITDVVCNNDFNNSKWINYIPKEHKKLDNVLFAPLIIKDKAVGLLGLANKPKGFSDRDVSMAKAFSELAAVTLTYVDHQEKLVRSEDRFKKLFENMQSGVAIYEPIDDAKDFKIVGFNKKAKSITKLDSGKILGRTLLEEFPNMIHTPFYKALQKVYKTKKEIFLEPFYYIDEKREGWRENYIYTLPSGEIVAIFSDVTERIIEEQILLKQSEDLLKEKTRAEENEEKFKRVVNNLYDLICELDENKVYTFVNKRYYDVLGYKPEELIGQSALKFIHPDDIKDLNKTHNDVKKNNNDSVNIWRFKDKKGNYKHFEFKSNTYIDKNNIQRTVVISQDITEKRKYELDLIEAKNKAEESDRLKTEFLNNMSHEIRTPMNGIIGFSEILDQKELSSEKRSYYTSIIKNSSNQLLRIIDDILEISTLETKQVKPNFEKLCLNSLLMELFTIFSIKAKENNIHLYIKKGLNDSESYINTDRVKLCKVLNNLLENALKFTFEGFVEIGYVAKNNFLELYIKDSGIGIAKNNFDVIFKRFSQEDKILSRKAGGLGLGLSIAKENIELIGGTIRLESEKGEGTTFFITLPHTANVTNNEIIDEKNPEKKTIKILVAEDEEVNYLYIEEVLKYCNDNKYEVIHAKNGKETLDICSRDSSIDLVLMDIKMPILNGYEAAQQIKKIRPDLPIIAQTAFSTEKDRDEALSNGCDEFISKPINKENLFMLLNKHLTS